jgi:hypothetical protein
MKNLALDKNTGKKINLIIADLPALPFYYSVANWLVRLGFDSKKICITVFRLGPF